MLIGYGAHALCPYLAYETARQWRLSSRTQSLVKSGKVGFGAATAAGCCSMCVVMGFCCCSFETARQWRLSSRTQSLVKSGKAGCCVAVAWRRFGVITCVVGD
jgi:hypothetical protein